MPAQGARKPIHRTVDPVKVKAARAPSPRVNEATLPLEARLRLPIHQFGGCPFVPLPGVYVMDNSVFSMRVAVCDTVMVMDAEVLVLPAASRATAVSVCVPLATLVVSQAKANGALVSSMPAVAPSTMSWTPATPMLSEALALTIVVPATRTPTAGSVIATDGRLLSTTTGMATLVAVLPAASRATAVSRWDPSAAAVVFQETE